MIIFTGESVSNFDIMTDSEGVLMTCNVRQCSWSRGYWTDTLHDLCEAAEEHRKECKS